MLYDVRGRLHDPSAPLIEAPQLTRAELRGASPWLLNVNGAPAIGANQYQGDAASVYQGFPADADTLLRWLGGGAYPAGFGVANVLAIYECDTASPLVDSLGLGPNLVAAGGPLTGRECVGLGQAGSFGSKVGCEILSNSRFVDAGAAFADINGTILSGAIVFRPNPNNVMGGVVAPLLSKWHPATGTCWKLASTGGNWQLYVNNGGGDVLLANVLAPSLPEGAWHCIFFYVDDIAKTGALFSDAGDNGPGAYAGAIANAGSFSLGTRCDGGWGGATQQTAFVAIFNVALTSAMRANFWRHGLVHVPYLHARTNPLIAPISPSRVAAWSGGNVGQAALGYDASLVTAPLGNPLGTGYVCEDGATFEPIGSDNFYTNTAVAGGSAKASVDGPSAMRDGCRVTMGGAWAAGVNGYLIAGGVVIAGASNVPWRQDLNYRRATVNTTARHGLYFTGDGGGPEFFTLVADAASPVDWTRAGGTCTPAGPAHTAFFTQYGAAANLDNCDFGEPAVIKNRTTAPLAWRRVGIGAAAQTTTPAYQITNTNNYVFNPLRGKVRLVIGGFVGGNGATFLQFGAAAAAGSLTLDISAGQLRLRLYDTAAVLCATVLAGPVTAARHEYVISWSSDCPIRGIGGAYAAISEGATVIGAWLGPGWVAEPNQVSPLYYGTDAAIANAARCYIEEC